MSNERSPLDEFFNLPPTSGNGRTDVIVREIPPAVIPESYDGTDSEIHENFHEVYETAMTAYETQVTASRDAPPQFKSRNLEVANQFLSTALSAAMAKATFKNNRDKQHSINKRTVGSITQNNIIVAGNRNEVMKALDDIELPPDAFEPDPE